MRRGALPRVIAVCALGAVGLGGFETVAHGDLLPPLPTTTTVTVPTTLPPLPTSTTVPLPPVTTATVRLPTTTTVPVPTTTVRLPTTTAPLPTTTVRVPVPTTTAPVRLPTTTTSVATSTAARGGAAAPVSAGAKPAGTRAPSRARAGKRLPVLRAARVSARTPGLAAFYAGLEKALANDTTSVVDGGATPKFVWPAAAADGGVLSRNGALALAIALFALALLLAFSLLPRLAAIGFLPVSRTTAQAARESSLVALGAITVCALLAILLLRTAL